MTNNNEILKVKKEMLINEINNCTNEEEIIDFIVELTIQIVKNNAL